MKKTTKNLTSFLKFKLENPKAIFGGLGDENNNNGTGGTDGGGTDPVRNSQGIGSGGRP